MTLIEQTCCADALRPLLKHFGREGADLVLFEGGRPGARGLCQRFARSIVRLDPAAQALPLRAPNGRDPWRQLNPLRECRCSSWLKQGWSRSIRSRATLVTRLICPANQRSPVHSASALITEVVRRLANGIAAEALTPLRSIRACKQCYYQISPAMCRLFKS